GLFADFPDTASIAPRSFNRGKTHLSGPRMRSSTLQLRRGLSTAESPSRDSNAPSSSGASIAPRSFNRGKRCVVWLCVWQEPLQLRRGLSTAESDEAVDKVEESREASIAP